MSRYHLQARAFVGPLARPLRDEVRLAESSDRSRLEAQARALVDDGFTVWIFEHRDRHQPTRSGLRIVSILRSDREQPETAGGRDRGCRSTT